MLDEQLLDQHFFILGSTDSGKSKLIKRLLFEILANTRTKLLMGAEQPEEVGKQAGTKYQVESSIQYGEDGLTGMGSSRIQRAFRVDMNEAARQLPGEAFVIRQRFAARVKTRMIGAVPAVAPQEPELLLPNLPAVVCRPATPSFP